MLGVAVLLTQRLPAVGRHYFVHTPTALAADCAPHGRALWFAGSFSHPEHDTMTAATGPVTSLPRADFVARYGGVFEHSAWVAEGAFDAGLGADADTAGGLHAAMTAIVRAAPHDRLLALINAHPDLAGRLARAGRLTADSTKEQASAGLDHLTDDERARFERLNDAYKAKFGFPFIMAVKGASKTQIMDAFERRLQHDAAQEFATALEQIEKIARLRLDDMLG